MVFFTVLVVDELNFYVVNRKKTLENTYNNLFSLESNHGERKACLNSGLSGI